MVKLQVAVPTSYSCPVRQLAKCVYLAFFYSVSAPRRINSVYRIVLHVDVRVPAKPTALLPLDRVSGPEAARRLIQIPCPQVVEAQVAIELLAAVFEGVGGGARSRDQAAESVVLICVGDGARRARQEAHVAVAVVAVEARR